jgi:hypothetical protein
VRVVRDVLAPEALGSFHLAGGRLFVLQGERRLLALDAVTGRVIWQRWAPGAAFQMPPPRGRFQVVLPVSEDTLLVQASGRRWLLNATTGQVRHESSTPLERWPQAPLILEDGVVGLVPDSRGVELLDPATGKTRWTWPLPGQTTRSGEPPLLLGTNRAIHVVVPENLGYHLQRLDSETGKSLWARPPLLEEESSRLRFGLVSEHLEPGAWVAGPDALYHAAGNELTARSPEDGAVLWQRRLDGQGPWKLARVGETLLAWPKSAPASQFRFRSLLGSLQWQVGPLPGSAGASLSLLDAQTGALVQRINLEDVSPRLRLQLEPGPQGVSPSASLRHAIDTPPGMVLWWDARGLLLALGNRVKSLSTDASHLQN